MYLLTRQERQSNFITALIYQIIFELPQACIFLQTLLRDSRVFRGRKPHSTRAGGASQPRYKELISFNYFN